MRESRTLLALVIEIRGSDPWIAGDRPSIADDLLGPLLSCVALTPDGPALLALDGVPAWWAAISADPAFAASAAGAG